MASKELPSPSEMALITPGSEMGPPLPGEGKEEKVHMKKQLELLEGIAIILGIILGLGIFISPKGVIQEVDTVGTSLIIWTLRGLLSMIDALCYAESGTCIPKSGGNYAYVYEAYGPMPAFLYLWDAMLIFVLSTNAIMGLTVASYVLQPFFPNKCKIPQAAFLICGLTYLNCVDVKARQRCKMS